MIHELQATKIATLNTYHEYFGDTAVEEFGMSISDIAFAPHFRRFSKAWKIPVPDRNMSQAMGFPVHKLPDMRRKLRKFIRQSGTDFKSRLKIAANENNRRTISRRR